MLKVTYDLTDHDRAARLYRTKIEILTEMGAVETHRRELRNTLIFSCTMTILSRTIIGADPEISVVNNYLQMWDEDNVFVIGGSNFA